MSKKMLSTIFTLALALAAYAGPSNAITIGPNCSTCQGSTYTLNNLGLQSTDGANFDIYRIEYMIDTSGYTGDGTAIDSVALKISNDLIDVTLINAPGGTGDWTKVTNGGLNNAVGCATNNGSFGCAEFTSVLPGSAAVGGILTWTFDMKIGYGTLFADDLLGSSIKARYVKETCDSAGNNCVWGKTGDLVSETIPAPAILGLMAIGLMGIGASTQLRRRSTT